MPTQAAWVRPSERHSFVVRYEDGHHCLTCCQPQAHSIHDVPRHFMPGERYDAAQDFVRTGTALCDDCGSRVRPMTLASLPEHGCAEHQKAHADSSLPEKG